MSSHVSSNRDLLPFQAGQPIPAEVKDALAQCREMIFVGSKSFSLASLLFGKETQEAAFFLYGWCRYCDDQIDQAKDRHEAEARLKELRRKTESAFSTEKQTDPIFIGFQYIVGRYSIPKHYAIELLEGMAMDVRNEGYENLQDLKLYCYRVASVVGLMMVHIMGISDERALKNASDLGMAMQLTNISRDVLEDFGLGRVYIPREWLRELNLSDKDVGEVVNRGAIANRVSRILDEAQKHYDSGKSGIAYLPFRAALAVSAASYVYSQIGENVRARGEQAWDSRTIVPQWKKKMALALGVFKVVLTGPKRLVWPFHPVKISRVYLFNSPN